jgi:4-hydroxy-tetrahydrodipicolinate reductase
MTAIGIIGSAGRMGQALAAAVPDLGATLAGGIDAGGDPVALARDAGVLVDFSTPAALERTLAAARMARTPILIGTTGLTPTHHALIDAAASEIAVLQTGNVSLGVTLLAKLVRDAAARLGPDWDIEIAEMHHRHKVDAPSGTALLLGEAAAAGRGITLAEARVSDRAGLTGARSEGTIGFASLRGGSVAGDHLVIFANEGERIEIGHRAENRAIFARGAITAALWLADKPAGRYSMDQVLGV